jgi:two-component system cell cycle sensor histidine kinase/response regulator CckA
MSETTTILAVDDTSESLALLVRLLTSAGYQVHPADSGELALAAVAANLPDLILLDVRMKGVDGLEVCRQLKARPESRHIPIILISAFADVSDWVEGLRLGAADYITKPFQPVELLTRVKTHLSLSRAHDSLERQAATLQVANAQLKAEIVERHRAEGELRQSFDGTERSRLALLSAMEDLKQAEAQTAQRTRQQAAIVELGQHALNGGPLEALIDRTVRLVPHVLDTEMCAVLEVVADRSALLLRAGTGLTVGLIGSATEENVPESFAGCTLLSDAPVVVEDFRTEKRFHATALLRDHGVSSGMSTTIGDFEKPYGVLAALTTRRRIFTVHDVDFLHAVANILASAVQRMAHEAEIERMNRLFATLSQVNQTVVRSTSREQLYSQLCRVAVEFGRFKAAWVGVSTADEGEIRAIAQHAAVPVIGMTLPGPTTGIALEAMRTGRPCLSDVALQNESASNERETLSRAGIRSCGAFPFQSRGEVAGVFCVCSTESSFFNLEEVRLLEEVASDVSFALEHYDQEANRTRAEESLAISQANLHSLLESTDDIIVSRDREGRVIAFNKAFASIMRSFFGVEATPGMQTADCLEGKKKAHWEGILAAVIAGKVQREEFLWEFDGSSHAYEMTLTPIRVGGEIVGTAEFTRDITERKRVEETLRESEDKFRQIFESANVGKSVTLPTGEIFVNQAFCDLLGYTREELKVKKWQDLTPPEDVDLTQRFVDQLLKGKKDSVRFAKRFVHRDGSLVWADVSSMVRRDKGGMPFHLITTIVDITEQRRAEEALRQSEEKFRLLIEKAVVGIFIIQDAKMAFVNPSLARMFGYSPGEIIGTLGPEALIHPDDIQSVMKRIQEGLGGEFESGSHFYKALRKDGTLILIEVYGMLLEYQGRPAVMGTLLEVTERKRAEEEKARLEGQLQQAQKMETVGQLAGGVAHDFNNMLQVISSYAELSLGKVDPGQPLHKYLLEIRRAAQRSADITGQLLAFARKQTVSPKVLDLNDAVAHSQKMIHRLIGEDIDLAWMPGHDLWKVKIDPSQLDQILANLAVNARDAIGGVGKLTVETANVTLDEAYCATHAGFVPGDYLLLAVSDDGRGMDKETLSHLFEPFFTTKGLGKGTGLGLATIYGIVKQNNGFINVYSEPGEGSTFKVYLPRAQGTDGDEAKTVEGATPRGGTETLLVAEDEGAILALAREMLEQLGYRVLTAGSPEEAMRVSAEHVGRIDLLITDVVMPQMNGRQLAQKLSAERSGLKVLYMSGYTADVIAHRGVLDEGVSFVAKPFSLAGLAVKVREALDG